MRFLCIIIGVTGSVIAVGWIVAGYSQSENVVSESIVASSVYASHCDAKCIAKRAAKRIWSNFTGGISSGLGTSLPGFGGNITTILPCTCNNGVAFIIQPVPGSQAGPYFVSWTDVKLFGSVFPGSWVLGNAQIGGQCVINVSGYCFSFPVNYEVSSQTGMGTSLF